MSTARRATSPRPAHRARGFTLVELIVTIAIALFLLGGLVTIVENTRITYSNQQALAQLQDQQRFAMSLLSAVIEAGGYYPNPTGETQASALPAVAPFGSGQPFYGSGNALANPPGTTDTLYVRFETASGDGVINCSGGQNTSGTTQVYTNEFSIQAGQLACSLNGGAWTYLVAGVQNLQIYYGVKRLTPLPPGSGADYNVDTYVSAANMTATDWDQVSAVRVILSFTNPLYKATAPQGQPPTLTYEQVIQVMARAGDYT